MVLLDFMKEWWQLQEKATVIYLNIVQKMIEAEGY